MIMDTMMTIVFTILHIMSIGIVDTVTIDNTTDSNWTKFKVTYGKNYDSKEDLRRRSIWKDNLQKIQDHNELYVRGLTTFYLDENQFADWTPSEFFKRMNGGYKRHNQNNSRQNRTEASHPSTKRSKDNFTLTLLPAEVNWVKKGYVTEVKSQGDCGASWAFSATGALEGAHYKKTGRLVRLSEKNLMDCTWDYGNQGCAGGTADNAFRYVIRNKGVNTEDSYPYSPYNDVVCHFNPSSIGATMTDYKDISFGSEVELQRSLATVGPVAVMVDADHFSFMTYKGGIYHEPYCSSVELNHEMLVVGYGFYGVGKQFWLVKNSFGPTWGERGYIKMSRNENNQCGIASRASYPVV